MLSTLIQVVQISVSGIEYSVWVAKKVYNTGYWIIYGTPKTNEAVEIAKLNKRIEALEQINNSIN